MLLNLALFAPAYFFREARPDFFPFFPKDHPHGAFGFDARSALEYVKALLLRRSNLDMWRVSFELAAACALVIALAGRRGAAVLRWVLGALYAGLLLFLVYHHLYAHTFEVAPAVWEDAMLAVNLFHWIGDSYGRPVAWLASLALAGVLAAVAALVQSALRGLDATASGWRLRTRVIASSSLLVVGATSLGWFGVARNDPVVQLPSKVLAENYEASLARRARAREVFGSVVDRRYQPFLEARLARRPTVHLLMIEAYGERLVGDPQMKEPFRELTRRAMERLQAKGYHARSAFSRAPIFGGRSWLSIGTVQTGVRIEQPSIYQSMEAVAPRIPTLTRFFKNQGYPTFSLQPGNRVRDPSFRDIFERDRIVEGPDLEYTGESYDWGVIPDQYSLSRYRDEVLSKNPTPYFSFYMAVSTHHKWPPIPFAADWRTLNTPELVRPVPYEPIAGADQITEGKPRRYFEAVVYEWRALLDFIEAETADDVIFIIVGDHQPLIERTTDAQFATDVAVSLRHQSLNTPVHVIARDEALLKRFAARGFTDGLFAEPGTGGLMHEGLFSLLVTELVGEYGESGHAARVRYIPEGLSVSTFAP